MRGSEKSDRYLNQGKLPESFIVHQG
jgi:hypothetical protein